MSEIKFQWTPTMSRKRQLYEFKQMPFGLKNAAATFQSIINNIFLTSKNTVTYSNDILSGSPDEVEHKKDLSNSLEITV